MRLCIFVAAAAMLSASLAARADSFNVAGTFTDGSTVTGNLDIDTSLGSVVSGDLVYMARHLTSLQVKTATPAKTLTCFS